MVRFLHTADWQLGAHLAFLGEQSSAARAVRLRTVERLVEVALEESVDFVLVAGDVFDSADVPDETLRALFASLERLGDIPIALLPGNHDPAVPGGIWDRSVWDEAPPCVRRLTQPVETELVPGVCLYPCPVRQKVSRVDPTQWIPGRPDGDSRLRIGLAHGALDVLPQRGNFPISSERAEAAQLDYLALGDWHTPLVRGRMAYAGAPEPCTFRERDSGHVLLVELDDVGAEPAVERRHVAHLVWQSLAKSIEDVVDLDQLRQRLHPRREELVLDLQLEVESEGMANVVEGLVEELRGDVFFLRVGVQEVAVRPLEEAQVPLAVGLDVELREALEHVAGGGSGPEIDGRALEAPELSEARRLLARLAQKAAVEDAS